MDIPLKDALLLWNAGFNGGVPAFAVRPIGHPDYDRYDFQNGACFASWQELASRSESELLAKAMIELWHIVAFYDVPVDLVREAMLVVPEYRNALADDCLPARYRHEREN